MVYGLTLLLTMAPTWELTSTFTFVREIVPVDADEMWCTTSGGIFHYTEGAGVDVMMSYPGDIPWYDVKDMIIDSSGRMWLATNGGGVALEDGDDWTLFTSYEGVPGSGVVHTIEDTHGYVWIGSDGGFARGGDTGFVPIDESSTGGVFRATEVTDIASLGDVMWLATDRGVYALDLTMSPFVPGAWTSYEAETLDLGIDGIYADGNGVYGFGSGGVAWFEDPGWRHILDYTAEPDSVVFGLGFSGDTLVAGARGAFWYDGTGWHQWGSGFPAQTYASCVQQAAGRLWFGMGSEETVVENYGLGLGYLDGGAWKTVTVPGMPNSNCYQMTFSGDRFYIGSHTAGLQARYPVDQWRSFGFADGMPVILRIYTAAPGPGGGIWTAAYHYGLTWLFDNGTYGSDDDTLITFVSESIPGLNPAVTQIEVPLLNNQVRMVCPQSGGWWAAQIAYWETPDEPSGIVGFRGEPLAGTMQWAPRSDADGLASPNTRAVYAVGSDSLWIAFEGQDGCQLLVHGGDPADDSQDSWRPGPNQSYTVASGLPSNQVFCFAREPGGSILVGTGSGLARFENGAFSAAFDLTGTVKAMQVDENGDIWCMLPDGMARISSGTTTIYNSVNSDYLPTFREVAEFSLYDQAHSDIYFSSIIGLWRIHLESDYESGGRALFYPQPWLPGEELLHMCGVEEGQSVTVDIFSLDGRHLARVEAPDAESWSWDGEVDGSTIASGMYMSVVGTGDGAQYRARIAVVR